MKRHKGLHCNRKNIHVPSQRNFQLSNKISVPRALTSCLEINWGPEEPGFVAVVVVVAKLCKLFPVVFRGSFRLKDFWFVLFWTWVVFNVGFINDNIMLNDKGNHACRIFPLAHQHPLSKWPTINCVSRILPETACLLTLKVFQPMLFLECLTFP